MSETERLTLIRRLLLTANRRRDPAVKARLLERARQLVLLGFEATA